MATVMTAFQQAQPTGIDLVQRAYLEWLESQENERAAKYAQFRDYYAGEHLTQLTKRMRAFLELKTDQEFSLNFCPIVVDSLAEKLKVAKFECDPDADLLAEWWKLNRMDAQQAVVHLAGVRDGDTYVLVEWDNEKKRPRFTQENAYDGTQGLHVIYGDERHLEPVVAIKRWTITSGRNVKTRRTNLYYADRIEKYTDLGTGQAWQPFAEDGQSWPIPWTDSGGEGGVPLGIPIVHFRNKDQGYSYGESELEDVVPMSNALNKTLIDLLAAADTTGFRNYWMTGGKPEGMSTAPGSWLYNTSPEARIGNIDGADLTGLISLKDSVIFDIARLTRTPLSSFQITGQVAAAGTLKEQRSGLIAKARDRQTVFGNAWEDVMAFGRKLHNVFGPGGMNEEAEVSTVWADDEKPDDSELATQVELLTRAQAASTQQKVIILHPDWTEEQVAKEVALIQAEQAMAVPDIGPPAGNGGGAMTPEEMTAGGVGE